MDIDRFNEFKGKIERRLNEMDAKISFLHDGFRGLSESHKNFQEEMTDFMSFIAEGLTDHEQRISSLEKRSK